MPLLEPYTVAVRADMGAALVLADVLTPTGFAIRLVPSRDDLRCKAVAVNKNGSMHIKLFCEHPVCR